MIVNSKSWNGSVLLIVFLVTLVPGRHNCSLHPNPKPKIYHFFFFLWYLVPEFTATSESPADMCPAWSVGTDYSRTSAPLCGSQEGAERRTDVKGTAAYTGNFDNSNNLKLLSLHWIGPFVIFCVLICFFFSSGK